ncbi:hypothetical protein tpqmel_0221 [Candidatus Gastranaerophilus sp. (ex Termes propinquus)]|nr:hypothetical protein tpqmel_0221 [Candidatus Gastranaerophilus sp. (ex Termes propinquus)]
MSKTSKTQDTGQTLNLNGQRLATVNKGEWGSTMDYQMNPWEQQSYNFAQQSFAENLPNINVFSSEVIQGLNSQVEAFKNQGIKSINEIYMPMLKDLQNDIATRFGNMNNSVFMDKLYGIESKRADSVAELAQNVAAKRQELTNKELANRYDYLNFLNSYQNQALQNMYNALGAANGQLPVSSKDNTNYDTGFVNILSTLFKAMSS